MAKYDVNASINATTPVNGNGQRRERAVAWGNIVFRLKDGATTQMGLPFMESDYVQRTIIHALKGIDDEAERNEMFKKLLIKAIERGDVDFRFVVERDESAVGELEL